MNTVKYWYQAGSRSWEGDFEVCCICSKLHNLFNIQAYYSHSQSEYQNSQINILLNLR